MCKVCKTTENKLYKSVIHKKNMEPIEIKLCFSHDLELFKRGQDYFILKYKHELTSLLKGAIPSVDPNEEINDMEFT